MSQYSPLRRSIVEEAKRHLLTVSDDPKLRTQASTRLGADKLREIITEACETPPAWTADNLKALETPGTWLNINGRGGTTDSAQAVHWCGMFATYVLRKAGLDVKWRSGQGIFSRGGTNYLEKKNRWQKNAFDAGGFDTGDVVVIPKATHHFIVVEAAPDSKTMRCIAGNGSYQQIEWQTHARAEIVTHYSLVWDPFASRL